MDSHVTDGALAIDIAIKHSTMGECVFGGVGVDFIKLTLRLYDTLSGKA